MDYSPEVVERFVTAAAGPRGALPGGGGGRVVSAEAEDRTLNVWVRFRVEVCNETIRTAAFEVFGCPHTVAAASWAAQWLEGGAAERLGRLDAQRLGRALGVPTEKLGKLLRIEDALAACAAQLTDSTSDRDRKEG